MGAKNVLDRNLIADLVTTQRDLEGLRNFLWNVGARKAVTAFLHVAIDALGSATAISILTESVLHWLIGVAHQVALSGEHGEVKLMATRTH